jgi:uncharacterized protein
MTRPDAAAVLRQHIAAFNQRDLDALIAGFTDDAVWVTGTTAVRGRTGLTALFESAMAGLLPTLAIENLLAGGDRAACQMTETYTFDGEARTDAIAGFYRLRGGRIASAKIYREGSAEVA